MGREGTNPLASTTRHNTMNTHYNVKFFDLLPGFTDETGWIDEEVVIVEAEGSDTFRYTSGNDFLGNALPASCNGKPVIAHVVIVSEHEGNEVSRLVRRYLIGDPGLCVAVRFTSTAPHGLISKACVLHDLNDDLALYDLGRNSL
jgi:hypothetical protein